MAKASNTQAAEAGAADGGGPPATGRQPQQVRGKGRRRKSRRRRSRAESGAKRARETSRLFPAATFSSALALAEAIQQHSAGQPVRRLTLFEKLNRSPESGPSRMMITNSNRYGLTTGGYQADVLELTDLGKVATSPETQPRERLAARFKLAIESVREEQGPARSVAGGAARRPGCG